MAAITLRFRKNAKKLEEYMRDKPEILSSTILCNDCSEGNTYQELLMTQKLHERTRGNEAMHLVQSWSPEESKGISGEQAQEMGRELADAAFPNHEALVVTHFDTDHLHNHIMINPVNLDTGDRIYNKLHHQDKVREISNEFSKKRGMSVIVPNKGNTRKGYSKALLIEKSGRFSHMKDLEKKALFASNHARNFDEFTVIMKEFDIETKVQNKNTSFKHPDQTKYKRGAKLNSELTNDALLKKFSVNKAKVPNGKILDNIKNDPELNKIKAVDLQRNKSKAANLEYIPTPDKIGRTKTKKFDGIILTNEAGQKFFYKKDDPEFNKLLVIEKKSKEIFIQNASSMRLFNKKGKILVESEDGQKVWIGKELHTDLFDKNKNKAHFNTSNLKHYYINSSYQKNRFDRIKDNKYIKIIKDQEHININKILKENSHVKEFEILDRGVDQDFLSSLIKANKSTLITSQKRSSSIHNTINSLSR